MRIVLALLAFLTCQATCEAGDAVQVWSANQLKNAGAALSPGSRIDGHPLGAYGSHSASLWKRAASGEAELHKTKADLLVIQAGSATLVYGGAIVHAHDAAAGEIRGTSIRDGQSRRLSPGDIVHVSAGTPHQFILDKAETVSYFALKIAR